MTQEEKNIKLAEVEDWRLRWQHTGGGELFDVKPKRRCWSVWTPPQKWWSTEAGKAAARAFDCDPYPPDYFRNLNAVHELEEKLDDSQKMLYVAKLSQILSPSKFPQSFRILHATAEQRCEAIGKTLNLW